MRRITRPASFMVVFIFMLTSCRKDNTNANLALIQHKWSIISLNGEALHYVGKPGDYVNFATDGKVYYNISGSYDTSVYTLSDFGGKINFYLFHNGIQSNLPSTYDIRILNSATFIYGSSTSIPPFADSLKR